MLMSWLFGTNQGAKFVVDKAMRSIPANVQTGSVNGKLAGGLEIEGIKCPVIRHGRFRLSVFISVGILFTC